MNRDMIEDRYLKDNKFFGQLVGVWPYQKKLTKYATRLIISIIVISTNLAQLARVIFFYSLNVLTDQLPFLVLGFSILLKHYSYILNEKPLSELLNDMVNDFLTDRPKEEIAILEMYARKAMLYSFCYKVSICLSVTFFIFIPAVPPILDIVTPQNESRKLTFPYPTYYFVDEEEYYFLILGHEIFTALTLGVVFIACDMTLIHVVQHACALFAVSGYRFEHAMDHVNVHQEKYATTLTNRSYSVLEKNYGLLDKSYAKVIQSILVHKRAMEYVKTIEICHVRYIFLAIGMIVTEFAMTFERTRARSMNIVRMNTRSLQLQPKGLDTLLLHHLTTLEIGMLYITFCTFTVAQLSHLLFLTAMGQFVIDSNEEIYQKITEAEWYNSSTKTQALYVLVLRRCLSPPILTGGGVITMNLDNFVQILKVSFSYFTVMKSS